jgi:NAD(P)H-dependent FMN reductase
MSNGKTILGLVGSPRNDGLTNQLVSSALKGAERAGAATEIIQMSEHAAEACKDCMPWVCAGNLKCTYEDEGLDFICKKMLSCDGFVFGTPVYWGDTSGLVRYLMLKMFRIYARSRPMHGIPAYGIAIAGGSGNGLISGLRPLYHFFRIQWMRGIEPLPATRFDLKQALVKAEEGGFQVAGMAKEPFADREARDLWYDNVPYISLTNAGERKLLAALAYEAVPEAKKPEVKGGLVEAEKLEASGRMLESMQETTKIIDSSSERVGRG